MKKAARVIECLFYIAAGLNHLWNPPTYLGMIPPYVPNHILVNVLAGVLEITLGMALAIAIWRKAASYGIIIMLLVYIPAHIYFIQIGSCIPGGLCVPQWVGWVRLLAIHPLLIAWAWWCRK